jgi:hypothetical protein
VLEDWFRGNTRRWQDWSLEGLLEAKQQTGQRVSLVVPARNEEPRSATLSVVCGKDS